MATRLRAAFVSGTCAVFSLASCSSNSNSDRIAELEAQIAELSADATPTSSPSVGASNVTQPSATATAPSPMDSTRAPTPSRIDYAQQYLDWVSPSNCALEEMRKREAELLGDDLTFYEDEWPALRSGLTAAYRKVADSLIEAINESTSLTWPQDLRPNVDSVIEEMSELAALTSDYANATSFAHWNFANQRAVNFGGRTQASLLRSKLGLPTNIGNDTSYC